MKPRAKILDDTLRLATAAARADPAVRLEIWLKMIHDWPSLASAVPEK